MYSFYDEMLMRMGLSDETVGLKITVCDFRGVSVEGHGGLIAYSPEEIILRVKRQRLRIFGENLVLREANPDEVFILGKIVSLEVQNG